MPAKLYVQIARTFYKQAVKARCWYGPLVVALEVERRAADARAAFILCDGADPLALATFSAWVARVEVVATFNSERAVRAGLADFNHCLLTARQVLS